MDTEVEIEFKIRALAPISDSIGLFKAFLNHNVSLVYGCISLLSKGPELMTRVLKHENSLLSFAGVNFLSDLIKNADEDEFQEEIEQLSVQLVS